MNSPEDQNAQQFIVEIAGHLLLARALGIAAELRIADLVATDSKSVTELAQTTGADEESLFRLLRMLASYGVFAADEHGRIISTPRADILRTDHPDSLRGLLGLDWQNVHWATFEKLPEAVMHGDVAFERAFGQEFFEYLAAHPEINAVFDRRMAAVSRAENPPIAAAYPFSDFSRVVDIGGGRGGLLAAILHEHPDVATALFEQSQVLADAADLISAGLLERVELIAGDFFELVPEGMNLYVMKRIIHDWEDKRALRILRNCRAAMAPGSRILVIDAVMQPGNDPDPNKHLDMGIMALTPGKERTAEQFEELFTAAGLRLTRIVPVAAPALVSIVEGVCDETNG